MRRLTDMNKVRLLLIEDNISFAQSLQRILSDAVAGQFDIVCFDHLSTGLDRLEAGDIDAILLDLFLPDSSSIDTFFRTQARAPLIPIIVLTSLDDESIAQEAIRGGAQDYLIKGKDDGDLIGRAIRYAIERKRAQLERELLIQHAEGAHLHDKRLDGLLPICMHCKRIRNDTGNWQKLETYIREHSEADFSHGLCPECSNKLYADFVEDEE